MKTTKDGKFLTTVPVFTWWLSDRIEERHRKKRAKYGVIDKLEHLHRLKERGAINEDDFQELKKLKKQI